MLYPMLENENTTRDMIDSFGGYNHNLRINDNEFFDMLNMSSDSYPTLSTRKKRSTIEFGDVVRGNVCGCLYTGDFYCVSAENHKLSIYSRKDNSTHEFTDGTDVADDVQRQLVMTGAYLIVMPDKMYINTSKWDENGKIEASFSSETDSVVTVKPCDSDGETYEIDGVYAEMPEKYWDGYVWLDINTTPATLKRYSAGSQIWSSVATNYIRVTCSGIGKTFKAGDGVEVNGFVNADTTKLNGNNVVKKVIDDDNIVIMGLLETVQNQYTLTVKNSVDLTEKTNVFEAYCDEQMEENALAGKEIVIGNKIAKCISNTPKEPSYEKMISEDENKWLADNSRTLLVAKSAQNTKSVWVYSTYDGIEGIRIDELGMQITVKLGDPGVYANVLGYTTSQSEDKMVCVHFDHPVTVEKDTLIYPVDEFVSESLYTTNITTDLVGFVEKDDGVSLTLEEVWKQTDAISLKREMPNMDFIVESKNRLWGCRYGKDKNGNFVNEIYASKLGDFKNWSCYEGISTDSYRASLGTDGPFTGAISYQGYPMFFKENYLHMVYGSYPAQYQINDSACNGVEKGSENSLAILNEVLYYKSKAGVMAYTGSYPSEISYQLGSKSYKNAIACAHKGKYYIEVRDIETDELFLFIYDSKRGLWHKEEAIKALQLCSVDDDVYCLTHEKSMIALFNGNKEKEEDVVWYAETGEMGLYYVDKKYVSRISIRLSVALRAKVSVYIQYDSNGEWIHKMTISNTKMKTTTLPIRPRRCDHFKIKIAGQGNVKIYSISKTLEQGSDM